MGIEPEYQAKIWGMFERVHPKEKYDGTGIGLAIVRKAVERMGGPVGVESDGTSGSRFRIQLRAVAPPVVTPATSRHSSHPLPAATGAEPSQTGLGPSWPVSGA